MEAAFKKVYDKAHFILGEEVESLEKEAAKAFGFRHAVAVASGTDAVTLALYAIGIERGDTVVTVPNSAPATAMAIHRTGASVTYCDVDEEGLMNVGALRPEQVRQAKAFVPVHLYGRLSNVQKLLEIGTRPRVIEDACQAHGTDSSYHSIGLGTSATAFSFYPTKNVGGLGDGGMVCTNIGEIAKTIRMLRNYGIKEDGAISLPNGMNSRLDELQAAFLRIKLQHLEEVNEYKRTIAKQYAIGLSDVPYLRARVPGERENCHIYPIFCEDRDHLKSFLETRGIQTLIHYPIPAHRQPFEGLYLKLPVAETLSKMELSLPNWYGMPMSDVSYVCHEIRRFYGKAKKEIE